MKRFTAILLAILFVPCLCIPAFAAKPPNVSDQEGLLTEDEYLSLMEQISYLQEAYGIDAMIVTTDSFGGKTAQEYADDYYEFLGGGEDGILFLLSMTQREWYISTVGSMIYALTDYGIQELGEDTVWYLTEVSVYDGFSYFLEALPIYLEAYHSGRPVDGQADYSGSYYHGAQEEIDYYEDNPSPNLLISIAAGLIVAVIAILVMRSGMNTKRPQHSAHIYLKEGSYRLASYQDLFLYSNVTKTRRQQNNSSGGGGSSVHRSSSGRRHGGGGGRF